MLSCKLQGNHKRVSSGIRNFLHWTSIIFFWHPRTVFHFLSILMGSLLFISSPPCVLKALLPSLLLPTTLSKTAPPQFQDCPSPVSSAALPALLFWSPWSEHPSMMEVRVVCSGHLLIDYINPLFFSPLLDRSCRHQIFYYFFITFSCL